MKLLIKQRVFSWSETYDVYDEEQNSKYFVKGKVFSMNRQIFVYDTRTREELGSVQQKLFTMMPQFDVYKGDIRYGTIKKKFTMIHPKYEMDYKGWYVEGDTFGWNYEVYKGDTLIFRITKKILEWGDTYELDIQNEEDEFFALMLVIAIDAANARN
ncbi:MAG: hypothetical protein E7256_12985 [Lachnospiraceae bacterium]|nr:hypothetical protein [Lachnospiraceae bacterium]